MQALYEMTADGRMISAYGETLKPLATGVLISAFFGVAIGVGMGLNRLFQWFWEPIFVVLQASPVAALIPLITYAYGIGLTAKTVAVIMLAAPIIVLNTYKAVRNASPSLIQMCRSFQGTRTQEIWKVIIPSAAPVIFAGLRLGVAAGFIGVILAELLITPTGLGDLISYHRSIAEYPQMYAAVLTIIVFSARHGRIPGNRRSSLLPARKEERSVMVQAATATASGETPIVPKTRLSRCGPSQRPTEPTFTPSTTSIWPFPPAR